MGDKFGVGACAEFGEIHALAFGVGRDAEAEEAVCSQFTAYVIGRMNPISVATPIALGQELSIVRAGKTSEHAAR